MSDEPALTLSEAADLCRRELFPSGRITARSLRTERERGTLQTFRVAGKVFTTRSMLLAMIEACKCPAPGSRSGLPSDPPAPTVQPDGSSSTEASRRALAAARMTLQELKPRSRPISRAGIGRPSAQPIASRRSSSPT